MKSKHNIFTFRNIILVMINLLIIRTCAILYYSMPIAYNTNDSGIVEMAIIVNLASILVNMIVVNALIFMLKEDAPSPAFGNHNL